MGQNTTSGKWQLQKVGLESPRDSIRGMKSRSFVWAGVGATLKMGEVDIEPALWYNSSNLPEGMTLSSVADSATSVWMRARVGRENLVFPLWERDK